VVQRSSDGDERSGELSRRTFLTRAGGMGVAAFMGAGLVACGDSDSGPSSGSASGSSKRLTTVKIIQPSDVTLVLWSVDYLSEDLGFYKGEGLAVERVPLLGGPVALQGLLSGAGACNISTPGEMLGAIGKGQGVKALMSHTNRTAATLVIAESFAKKLGVSAQDSAAAKTSALGGVKGARFGITTPGSQTDGFTRMALKQAGLDPDKDARIVPLQTAANSLAALEKSRIDGFMALSPVTEQAIVKLKAVPLLAVTAGDIRDAYRLQGQTLMARTSDLEAHPELYQKLVRANVRAMKVLVEEPDRARDVLRKTRFADVDEGMWALMWKNNLPTWRTPFIAREALAAWLESGLVADQTDVAGFPFDRATESRLVEEAVDAVGWNVPRT
jgi:ABC-type nitrate/sulfonate/bicarbonate transport system substrate-binding protein